jgi:hypothetical protein
MLRFLWTVLKWGFKIAVVVLGLCLIIYIIQQIRIKRARALKILLDEDEKNLRNYIAMKGISYDDSEDVSGEGQAIKKEEKRIVKKFWGLFKKTETKLIKKIKIDKDKTQKSKIIATLHECGHHIIWETGQKCDSRETEEKEAWNHAERLKKELNLKGITNKEL